MKQYLRHGWLLPVLLAALALFTHDGGGALLHLAAIPVGAAAVGLLWLRERSLSGPLRRIAHANGWTFTSRSRSLAAQWRGDPFAGGVAYDATSVLRGRVANRGFTAFNLNVTRRAGGKRSTGYYSVVALDMPIILAPVEVKVRVSSVNVGTPGIEFENEDFNRRYQVTCANPKLASDVLNPRAIEAVIAGRVVNLRIGGGRAVAWATGRLEVAEVLGWSRALVGVVDRVPDFVWKDHAPAASRLTGPAPASSLGPIPSPLQESP